MPSKSYQQPEDIRPSVGLILRKKMPKKIIDIRSLTSQQKDFLLMVFATSDFLFKILQSLLPGEMPSLAKNNNAYLFDTFNPPPKERSDLLQEYLTVDEDNADHSCHNRL